MIDTTERHKRLVLRRIKSRGIDKRKREKVLQAWNHRCAYCGVEMVPFSHGVYNPPEAATVDHIIPRWLGGTNHYRNLVAACHGCNRARNKADAPYYSGHPGHFVVKAVSASEIRRFQG